MDPDPDPDPDPDLDHPSIFFRTAALTMAHSNTNRRAGRRLNT